MTTKSATKKSNSKAKPRGRTVPPATSPEQMPVEAAPTPPPPPQSMDEVIQRLEADNTAIETERQRIATNANLELNRLQGIMESNFNTIHMLKGLPLVMPKQDEVEQPVISTPSVTSSTE